MVLLNTRTRPARQGEPWFMHAGLICELKRPLKLVISVGALFSFSSYLELQLYFGQWKRQFVITLAILFEVRFSLLEVFQR